MKSAIEIRAGRPRRQPRRPAAAGSARLDDRAPRVERERRERRGALVARGLRRARRTARDTAPPATARSAARASTRRSRGRDRRPPCSCAPTHETRDRALAPVRARGRGSTTSPIACSVATFAAVRSVDGPRAHPPAARAARDERASDRLEQRAAFHRRIGADCNARTPYNRPPLSFRRLPDASPRHLWLSIGAPC